MRWLLFSCAVLGLAESKPQVLLDRPVDEEYRLRVRLELPGQHSRESQCVLAQGLPLQREGQGDGLALAARTVPWRCGSHG
jgi:hypothetical protein